MFKWMANSPLHPHFHVLHVHQLTHSLSAHTPSLMIAAVCVCLSACFNFLCVCSARVAVAQSSSLNLFTNRDAELEQRAMLLKRVAVTISSSEVDQYQKYLPDIQGTHTPTHSHTHFH